MIDPLLLLQARAGMVKRAFFWSRPKAPQAGVASPPALPATASANGLPDTNLQLPAQSGRWRATAKSLRERLRRWMFGHAEKAVGNAAARFDRTYYPGE